MTETEHLKAQLHELHADWRKLYQEKARIENRYHLTLFLLACVAVEIVVYHFTGSIIVPMYGD